MRLIYGFLCLAIVAGCQTTCDRVSASSAASNYVSVAAVRYMASVGGVGAETVEVVVRNGTKKPVSFVKAELDGVELPKIVPSVQSALDAFRRGAVGGRVGQPAVPSVAGVRWWQFYPSPDIKAGGYASFQFNFMERSRPCRLALTTSSGESLSVHIPRYSKPKRRVEFLSFSGDGSVMSIRYSKGAPPVSVSVNGKRIERFINLGATASGHPGAVVAGLPVPPKEGDGMFVELEFPDGVKSSVFIRAMLGVCTVAPNGKSDSEPLEEGERKLYGFDPSMRIFRLPYDVACSDKKSGIHGMNAQSAVAAHMKRYASVPDGLSGIDFCTGLYPEVWNIYSQIGDVVISKPYKLHWGVTPQRFIDEEDAFISDVVANVAPRPVIWVPERFRWARELDGKEFETLAWCAFMRGVRGMRVHHWFNSRTEPFAGNQGLADAMRKFNSDFNRLRPVLERSIPMRCHERRDSRIKIYESWCGDEGVLLLVRNLRYDVGLDVKTKGRMRPYSVKPLSRCRFKLPMPKWFNPVRAADPLSGEEIFFKMQSGMCELFFENLQSYKLIWIQDTSSLPFCTAL